MNFFPSILNVGGYQFNNLTELNQEIALLQQKNDSPELLSWLINYRSDVMILIENISTDELLKNIMFSWNNYNEALLRDLGWVNVFKKDIGFFVFCLHAKLSQKPKGI